MRWILEAIAIAALVLSPFYFAMEAVGAGLPGKVDAHKMRSNARRNIDLTPARTRAAPAPNLSSPAMAPAPSMPLKNPTMPTPFDARKVYEPVSIREFIAEHRYQPRDLRDASRHSPRSLRNRSKRSIP